ncbi:MAG: helix-turn-helix transcriptional regulator [Candidatus Methylacidiphilales bacterium]|nr:WYL domain-containing protein [Candidatus Methylacidiphilales bacterium]
MTTRPPLDRMHRIFHLIKESSFPNRVKLALEIEVTVKTIQRDIDFMRDRLGLPIVYNSIKGGYHFNQPISQFPMMELSESEVVSVFVAQKALTQYKGTPFEQPLRSAFEKLTSSLTGNITLSWNESLISFRSVELTPLDLHTFRAVSDAVQQSMALEFEYKKLNSTEYQKRTIQPYHLACILNQWYLFGNDVDRKEMRTFVLARMRKPVVTSDAFTRPKKFSITHYLKDSFGVFSSKGMHQVKIRFDTFASQLIREWVWHPSQQITELADGCLELQLSLSSFAEIKPWVLSWGAHAKVLSPQILIDKVKEEHIKTLSQYS